MWRMAERAQTFDAAAERSYYREAPHAVRDFAFLAPTYRGVVGDTATAFRGKRVVDVGAGECLHGMFVCSAGAPRLYVNVDLFQDRMSRAAADGRFSVMRFAVGDSFALPLRAGAFDVVWSSFVLLRLRPIDAVVEEIARVLADGGRFIGVESNFWNPLVAVRIMRRKPGHPSWNPNDGYLSPRAIRRAFERRGFDVELKFFWRRLPWLRHRLLSPTLGVIATRRPGGAR